MGKTSKQRPGPFDRDFWATKASPESMEAMDYLVSILREKVNDCQLVYTKYRVHPCVSGKVCRAIRFSPQRKALLIQLRMPETAEWTKRFKKDELRGRYIQKQGSYRLNVMPDNIRQHADLWRSVLYRLWKSTIEEVDKKNATVGKGSEGEVGSIDSIIDAGESDKVEFKSTLRVNLHTNQNDPKIELSALKSIAGFLNGIGGRLIIGVNDDGVALGLSADKFPNEDKMKLHLINIVRERMRMAALTRIKFWFEEYGEERIFIIAAKKSNRPIFVKDGDRERFYVRTGPATLELSASETQEYIREHFA